MLNSTLLKVLLNSESDIAIRFAIALLVVNTIAVAIVTLGSATDPIFLMRWAYPSLKVSLGEDSATLIGSVFFLMKLGYVIVACVWAGNTKARILSELRKK